MAGGKPAGTLAQIGSVTADDVAAMQRGGLGAVEVTEIRDFYANDLARNANNLTVEYRVQLMDLILTMMP